MRRVWTLLFASLILAVLAGCSKDYCSELQKVVCEKAPNTKACTKARALTDRGTCKGYLANVDKYIKLMNLKVTTPPLKPPKQAKPTKDTTKEKQDAVSNAKATASDATNSPKDSGKPANQAKNSNPPDEKNAPSTKKQEPSKQQ